ncbi:hypothetical protein SAMN04489761_3687 [Tenacibaculum sp. MAR_2009_124]|uniref:hypothetical protein n=1 Tax=Tenacibaculum sp. MAR_2009_124 TaxID=1250059 RepID=UPI000898D86A|nr:hypothetical protein [Tenacibaculum sp. MAR_2009_124]SEC82355.1 hypothetical protein SAMN04489761_3686 [Tenacibaculum sp. MAR_2009_124]SEC82391.1 hypothetical protein SAMN04489761_3687 [Tenacibaculum sp. MAR_2009_124]
MENKVDQLAVELVCFGIGFLTVAFITLTFLYAGSIGLMLAPLSGFVSAFMGYYLYKDVVEFLKIKGMIK